jgi:hypothetical protein
MRGGERRLRGFRKKVLDDGDDLEPLPQATSHVQSRRGQAGDVVEDHDMAASILEPLVRDTAARPSH